MSNKLKYQIHYLTVFFLVLISYENLYSQQDVNYNLEKFISQKNNPAYTGHSSLNDIMLLSRQQWVGFEGAPRVYILAAQFQLRDDRTAIGSDLYYETIGPLKKTGMFFSYSFRLALNESASIIFGLKGGADIIQSNLANTLLIDPGDALFENSVNVRFLPNFGTGIHFEYANYYADISIPRILRNSLDPNGDATMLKDNKQDRIFIIGGGGNYNINQDITLLPSFYFWIISGSPLLFNIDLDTSFRELAGAGLSIRPGGSIAGKAWYNYNSFIRFGYSYGLPMTTIRGPQSGTHEVFFGYNLSFTRNKTLSPRKF